MRQTVEPDRTLLVDGPACVQLISGKTEVFGNQVKQAAKILVREGKRLPFFVLEKAVFDVSVGSNSTMQDVKGNSIPESWSKFAASILDLQARPVAVLVLGGADSGKSSLSAFLVNRLVLSKCKVGVLDGDIGQSDIGPSGTVGFAVASKPIGELYDLRLSNACFIGVTSPVSAANKTIEGLAAMKAEASQAKADYTVINTDGWVAGDAAIRYKLAMIKELCPDVIVGVQATDELAGLVHDIDKPTVTIVESSPSLNARTAEKRKALREMTYARYLRRAKVQCYVMSQLSIEPKNAVTRKPEPARGLLVGLYGSRNKFVGIGVLREINQSRKEFKVQTAVRVKPSKISVGKIVLDRKLREVQD